MAFRATVTNLGVNILDEMVFPDHWAYAALDLEAVRRRMHQVNASCALTTEKDAVKLASFVKGGDEIWAVHLKVEIKDGEERMHGLLDELKSGPEAVSG